MLHLCILAGSRTFGSSVHIATLLLGARLTAEEKDKMKKFHSVLGVDNFKDTFLKPLEEVNLDSIIVRPDGDPELAGN